MATVDLEGTGDDLKLTGPYTLEAKIYLTNGNGLSAQATVDLPLGSDAPTMEELATYTEQALERMRSAAANDEPTLTGWRLMTRNEFLNEVACERLGGSLPRFATKEDWDT